MATNAVEESPVTSSYSKENEEHKLDVAEVETVELESRFERITFQERLFANNSLLCLVRALVGKKTTVELRNEIAVHGTIVHVDFYMAVSMENCTVSRVLTGERLRTAPQMRLSGSKIRYVHIPDDVDVRDTITGVLAPPAEATTTTAKGARRRLRRDKDRHLRQNAEEVEEEEEEAPPAQMQGPKIFEKRREVNMGESELTVQDVLQMLNI